MNNKFLLAVVVSASLGCSAWAQLISVSTSQTDGTLIPDNDLNGVAETINFSGSGIASITSVQLTLNVSSGFNGDYYAYLTHGTGQAILLNRVGLDATNPFGYDDAGINVTFADNAIAGDIHTYQNVLNPNGGPITGTWQPDGRNVSPFGVSTSTPKTELLSTFLGDSADGDWTLFIADTSQGDEGTLDSWSLDVTGNPAVETNAPDAVSTLGLLASALGLLALARRRITARA
jgi:subtilisin-like proprotein convertase family protein